MVCFPHVMKYVVYDIGCSRFNDRSYIFDLLSYFSDIASYINNDIV